ncbi:hypothetical protein Ddye_003765 [Dipteronia dyeriana]|uniref:Reverse transcriptase zinc-binding domain-containing protein n=1 Tax=Dipteronia dyeriana TaxID=168575 RepID=A0AAD9XSV5_9ROSI|nr:hypothetical protein Ddye_003765 [Dipteronia dyeriana]
MILSIPCSFSQLPNMRLWHYDKLGSYSVKSGYHLAFSLSSNPTTSGLSISESWWKFLQRFKVPSKMKLLIWWDFHNWVPTSVNLANRGMDMNSFFPVCNRWSKTMVHVMWGCPALKKIRAMYSYEGKNSC